VLLFAGGGLEFLVCAAYGWYAVAAVAGDPQDGRLFAAFFGVPCGVAVMTLSSLLLALHAGTYRRRIENGIRAGNSTLP
jgi:hypothetical protein